MSVDNIKSIITKRGGLAKTNRFLVVFTPPTQALINSDPVNAVGRAAAGNFNFKQLISDPRDITFLCESTQLPGRSLNTLDYAAEKETLKIPNGFIDDDVTMTFLLTNDYYMKDLFESWMSSVIDTEKYQAGYKNDYQADVTIQQLNSFDKTSYGVRLQNAYPIGIAAIDVNNTAADNVQRVTVTFAYDRYIPENFVTSNISAGLSALPNLPKGIELPTKASTALKKATKFRDFVSGIGNLF